MTNSELEKLNVESLKGTELYILENGLPIESILNRIQWDVKRAPTADTVRIIRADYRGFYTKTETRVLLENSSIKNPIPPEAFNFMISIFPDLNLYSKVIKIQGKELILGNFLNRIYSYYSFKVNEDTVVEYFNAADVNKGYSEMSFKNLVDNVLPSIYRDKFNRNFRIYFTSSAAKKPEVELNFIFRFNTCFGGVTRIPFTMKVDDRESFVYIVRLTHDFGIFFSPVVVPETIQQRQQEQPRKKKGKEKRPQGRGQRR